MKKFAELVMFTLFFSSLAGMGLTAGFYCFIGACQWLKGMVG